MSPVLWTFDKIVDNNIDLICRDITIVIEVDERQHGNFTQHNHNLVQCSQHVQTFPGIKVPACLANIFHHYIYNYWGNCMITLVFLKQSWWKWINILHTSLKNDIDTTRVERPCVYCIEYTVFKIQDSNTFIHQNYMISTWIDTLALVMNKCRILSMSPSYNSWYGDPY